MKKAVALGAVLALLLTGCFFVSFPGVQPLTEKVIGGEGDAKILVVDISGIITEEPEESVLGVETRAGITARVKEQLELASMDDAVKAVVLRINTPGGSVTTCDIIYHELKEFKERENIPVYAEFMDLAASGGYYIAMAADEITAHPTTVTGSIGVVVYGVEFSGLMKKVGITSQTIRSGENKDMGSPLRPMTPDERRILQSVVDGMYDRFVDVVAESRGFENREKLRSIADGRVYTAEQALRLGLVDRIGYLDDAIEVAKKRAGLRQATVITYSEPSSYKNNIYSRALSGPSDVNLFNIDAGSLVHGPGMRFMYVWMP